jgi:hypothetical protein
VSAWNTSRLFAVVPVVSLATGYRMSASHLGVWSQRTPELVSLWLEAWEPVPEASDAANAFRQKLIATAHEATQVVVDELKRGIDDVDAWTRPASVAASPGPSS